MIIYINDFNRISFCENKNCPIFSVNSKTPYSHCFRFKEFGFQARMKWILFKQGFLFFKFSFNPSFSEIFNNFWMDEGNFHYLKYEDR